MSVPPRVDCDRATRPSPNAPAHAVAFIEPARAVALPLGVDRCSLLDIIEREIDSAAYVTQARIVFRVDD